jgi:ZIP family zinc transporter
VLAPASLSPFGEYGRVLLLALLPAAGNIAGGLTAELLPLSPKLLSYALHAAAGILIGIVAVQIVPHALAGSTPWVVLLAMAAGGAFYVLLDAALHRVQRRVSGTTKRLASWLVYFAVALDLFSDGLVIGTGSAVSLGLALVLSLGQLTADVPEGFTAILTFRSGGLGRTRRLQLSFSLVVPAVLGATLGFWGARSLTTSVRLAALAFAGGILLPVSVEDIMPQAHAREEARLAALAFVLGFVLFALASAYLGPRSY